MRNYTYITLGLIFIVMCGAGLGRQLVHQTLPTPLLLLSAAGLLSMVGILALMLFAARASRKGKSWGLKVLKTIGNSR